MEKLIDFIEALSIFENETTSTGFWATTNQVIGFVIYISWEIKQDKFCTQ